MNSPAPPAPTTKETLEIARDEPLADRRDLASAIATLPRQPAGAPVVPVGGPPQAVQHWFDAEAAARKVENDGSLDAAYDSARAYRSRAKANNTRAAYRSAVRAWCGWCDRHGVPALPARSADVAAFLAAGRDTGLAGNTLTLRASAIRFLHRAASLPSPTDTAEVAETMAGIRGMHQTRERSVPRRWQCCANY